MAEPTTSQLRTTALYDTLIQDPLFAEYLEGSDYLNIGWFEPGVESQRVACERLMEKLLAMMPHRHGRVLDVACGAGATTAFLARHWPPEALTGVNLSECQLEASRAKVPGASFARMDAARLTFPDESFDVVLSVEAAFHFDTREEFLQQAFRVLRPGGRLVVSDALWRLETEQRGGALFERNYLPDPGAYRTLLERIGFADVEILDATRPCWHGHFRFITSWFHEKFLARELDQATLERALSATYRRAAGVTYYLLAAGTKPETPAT